ncbi:MAG: ABC-type transport auxiliary lipoprotein family protein [Rhizobiaceae bacterium]
MRASGVFRPFLIAMVSLSLGSCALLGAQKAARETYEISVPPSLSGTAGGTGAQLLIKVPNALKAVDSDRIVVKTSPNAITYLEGAQWSDTVPRMVQAKLVEAFENTGSTGATAKPGDGLVIDYQLIPDIRRFEIVDGNAVIEISIKLLRDRSGKVVASRIFTARAAARGDDVPAYVESFDDAFADLARQIIRWVFSTV